MSISDPSKRVELPSSMEGKTVLVAGAAGFVPSTVSEFYLNLGAKVIGLDNFVTGSRSNIEILNKYENFEFHECNIYESLPDFSGVKIDYILSLASPASPIDFKVLPLEIMRVNSEGTMHLLELAKDKGARFLEASTSEVYGDPEIHPQREDYVGHVNPIGPRACYDEAKRFAEAMTMSYHTKYGVDTRIIRIFNTYGPRMRPNDGRVIPNFINQAMKGEDLTVYGDGLQTRSFCYVTDLVNAIHNVLFSHDHTPFNIGNPDEYTILDAAKYIIEALGSTSKIVHLELPKDDPKRRRPVLDKLQAVSDYRPQVSFKDGIAKTALYFKEIAQKN
ncbi:GDP-mannose 4,6-dehydratase [Halobacteriovorax sp. GB3]|uniref:NAD-dependent epimerase/dehydratase family protein n=1 Tax=Halobacteriovorax sp. GB3 TaxID=2719615 RepID=UPI00236223F5|nr:NAD-dependent epimerase/dehydratase family protein [Halobacteriovorax sp. GB3]MDD0853484.1 GDP-mannose 4,6-dehydratase [Halobacteriovorax sp. GB3]